MTYINIPSQLFEECSAAESDAGKFDITPLKFALAKQLLFGQPLFDSSPVVEKPPFMKKRTYLQFRAQFDDAAKYRDLRRLLLSCTNRESRLFVIAWWLKTENGCEPEDLLGREQILRWTRKRLSCLSKSEFTHANRVRAWLPYFEQLLRNLGGKGRGVLVTSGYDGAAVAAARGKRSAVEAACSWLADREPRCDALTLKNAFSKVYGPRRMRRMSRPPTQNSG